jgi:hypothetical protein
MAVTAAALFLLVAPPALLLPDQVPEAVSRAESPEQRLARLHADLAAGRAVTLLGEGGPPAWSRWVLAEAAPTRQPLAGAALSVHSYRLSLLELMPAVPLDRYRFSVEILHESGAEGHIGLYLLHSDHDASGHHHWLCSLTFSDHSRNARALRAREKPPAVAWMRVHVVRSDPDAPNPGGAAELPVRHPFDPDCLHVGRRSWRRLAVEITPEGVAAFFGDEPIGAFDWEALHASAARACGADGREPVAFRGPRLGLGLYLLASSAGFRRATLAPLPQRN